MEPLNGYISQFAEMAMGYAPKVLLAIVVLIVGFRVANWATRLAVNAIKKTNAGNQELQAFLRSIVGIGLKILVVISVAGIVGIETTSFVGIIAALSFAVGLALQGNLSNFAAGVMILLIRPFKVGDEVKIKGYWAYVKDIQIFHTVLRNFDQTEVILPNSIILNDTIHNLSVSPTRSLSIKLNIPYEEDLDKVEKLIIEAAHSNPKVDKERKPFFWIQGYEPHFIKISMAFSTTQEGFWNTEVAVNKAVIRTLAEHNIKVAYPTGVAIGAFGNTNELLNRTNYK